MNKELTNPFSAIIKKAAATLPAQTGKVAIQQAKIDRRKGPIVVLADVSHSMNLPLPSGQRAIDALRHAVQVTARHTDFRLIAFSAAAREVSEIPEPEDNTNLEAGLRAAREHDPGVTLVISDGHPDNARRALDVARTFRGIINVLYIGSDADTKAIGFMRELAAAAGGDVQINDIGKIEGARKLEGALRTLLPYVPQN